MRGVFAYMRSALIVDGQHHSEDGEGLLVEHIARRRFQHVVRLPYFPEETTRYWDLVWFTGHVTLYRSSKLASLEKREGATFYRLLTDRQLASLSAKLLVLSSCHTDDVRASWWHPHVDIVISHRGSVLHDDALVFAARFMPRFVRSPMAVRAAFDDARRSAGNPRSWRLREAPRTARTEAGR